AVPVRVEDIIQRIRREIAEEAAAESIEPRGKPVDAEALPKVAYRPELNYLNRNWQLFDANSEMRSHRRLLGPVVLRFKRWLRRLVIGVLDGYFDKERIFLRELVRFNNELAERSDRILREVTERTKAVAERNDLFLAAFDMRLEELEAREQMRAALASTPPPADAPAADGDEAALAEMADAIGVGVDGRVAPFLDRFRSGGRVLVLGCGSGDVLRSLDGIAPAVHGVETSPALVSACRARGFEVTLAGLRAHLESVAESSLGGLIMTGLDDRHPAPSWSAMVAAAWRSLSPGGVALFEGIRDPVSLARLRWLAGRQRFSLVDVRGFASTTTGGEVHVLVVRRGEPG
ncbi:MAG: class I SAM-dependent methyltransferase, partial [Candidatus Binatia bacterium]